jgi:hypothetical protein
MAAFAPPAPPTLALDDDTLARLARLGVLQGTNALDPAHSTNATNATNESGVLSLGWPELERVLPDRGLPRGVVEIASALVSRGSAPRAPENAGGEKRMLGGGTMVSVAAVRAVHAADPRAWCAWITESNVPSLYAPALAHVGVDLERLLVVRPPPVDLARTVVKVAASGAFDLVVIDAPSGLDGRLTLAHGANGARAMPRRGSRARVDGSVIVRKLALAAEDKGTTFILLTDLFTSRAVPWPVALRLEVQRRPEAIAVRVTKDRRGRASSQHVVRVAC